MVDQHQPTCCAGMQAMGTLLGTMFGFVSTALLTPIHGGGGAGAMPAAPGVIVGSSLGVLVAHSAGEENQPFRQLAWLLVLGAGAASATTAACAWLVGDILQNGGSVGIMVLATLASLSSTAVFSVHNHNVLLRRAAAKGEASAFDHSEYRNGDRAPLMGLNKEV